MLRLEREGVAEIGFEIGGALAGDPVDEIERDVVKSGITKMMHGAPDVVRTGNTLEHAQQLGLEGLRAERDARDAGARAARAASSGVTVSGFASTVTSAAGGSASSRRTSSGSAVNVGVPPPRKIVSSSGASSARSSSSSREQRVDVGAVLPGAADDGDEVAVAAAVRAERQVHVEMPRAAHAALRGRATSSPPQFGQIGVHRLAAARQKVHSNEQMPPRVRWASAAPQRSHAERISSAISWASVENGGASAGGSREARAVRAHTLEHCFQRGIPCDGRALVGRRARRTAER